MTKGRGWIKGIFKGALSLLRGGFAWGAEEKFRWFDWVAWGGYVALISFGLWYHEPWSDEAYAWVMARDSDLATLLGIIFHNYDNHPGLQHLLLFPFAKMGFPYEAQAVLNGLVAAATSLIFLRKAALPRITKYLFIFSFYMTFEYALIARPYTLAVFLIFCIAAAYPFRFRSPLVYGLLVLLLFNTDYIPFAFGIALLLVYGAEWYLAHRADQKILASFLLMVVAAAWVFKQGFLVTSDHYDAGVNVFYGLGGFLDTMRKALFPHGPLLFNFKFIEPGITSFCVLFFLIALGALASNPAAFLGLFLILAEFFYLFSFKRIGNLRHFGFLLVILLFGLWVSKRETVDQPLRKLWKMPRVFPEGALRKILICALTLCLAIELPFTFFSYGLEYWRVFSGAKEMGAIINAVDKQFHLKEKGYVIVTWAPSTTGVAAYLPGAVMWNACMERFIGYYPATKELRSCDDLSYGQLLERIGRQFRDPSKVLLLSKLPLTINSVGSYHFSEVARTNQRPFGYAYEKFFLYRIQKEPSRDRSGKAA